MKVHDLAEWQLQCAEFAADPDPLSGQFQKFIETWAEYAEGFLNRRGVSPIDGLRLSLRDAEGATQHWTIGFVGQALLLLCHHWAPITDREEFLASLTPIEQNLFADAAYLWQAKQQMLARIAGEQKEESDAGPLQPL